MDVDAEPPDSGGAARSGASADPVAVPLLTEADAEMKPASGPPSPAGGKDPPSVDSDTGATDMDVY